MFTISKIVQARSGWMGIAGTPTNPDPASPRLTNGNKSDPKYAYTVGPS